MNIYSQSVDNSFKKFLKACYPDLKDEEEIKKIENIFYFGASAMIHIKGDIARNCRNKTDLFIANMSIVNEISDKIKPLLKDENLHSAVKQSLEANMNTAGG